MSTLKVYPNPWIARDRNGLPCGVCPRDPEADGGGPGQFVGARVDRRRTEVLQKLAKGDDLRSPMQRTAYEFMGIASDDPALESKLFACEPVELPRSKYYLSQIRSRALIPADEATAKLAKVKFASRKCEPKSTDVAVAAAADPALVIDAPKEESAPLYSVNSSKKNKGQKPKAEEG
jgi:hypothetical protein